MVMSCSWKQSGKNPPWCCSTIKEEEDTTSNFESTMEPIACHTTDFAIQRLADHHQSSMHRGSITKPDSHHCHDTPAPDNISPALLLCLAPSPCWQGASAWLQGLDSKSRQAAPLPASQAPQWVSQPRLTYTEPARCCMATRDEAEYGPPGAQV